MASRDSSKPGVSGLNKARAERVHQGQSGSRPVGPEHYRKASDSQKWTRPSNPGRVKPLFKGGHQESGRCEMASTSKTSYENLRRAREARWSDPAQRQALAERNRARSSKPGSAWRRTKPGRSSMITISPIPAKTVETAHVQTVNFLSELRLNLLSDKELETSLREKVAHLQQHLT